MKKGKDYIILKNTSDGEVNITDVSDLIPVHSASMMPDNIYDNEANQQFDRAIEVIWNALMESSENLTSFSSQDSNNKWDSKPVSDA